ncbi:MAG: YlxM family DNA-binding protein [Peptococcaceae bacterium]|nr:YlxM family DNA-binding protein [Peptococcaceae bacterium]
MADEKVLDKFTWINLLYDFYGPLLTGRQRELFELYYKQDLSLGEIAEHHGISRQGVYDTIGRSVASLESYEKKLGLAQRFIRECGDLEEALIILSMPQYCKDENLVRVRDILQRMLEPGPKQ